MSQFSRLLPFVRPYFSQLALAGVLIMGVAALNLTLLKLGGTLWDLITVQRNVERMTQTILLFLVIAIVQSVLSMGQSYLNQTPVSYTHLRAPRDRTRSRMPSSA